MSPLSVRVITGSTVSLDKVTVEVVAALPAASLISALIVTVLAPSAAEE